jgi:predicted phage gp36 major capsid-like protein
MNTLGEQAADAGDDAREEEFDRLRREMEKADGRFRAEATERSDATAERLDREREEIERRLRDRYGTLPGGFASTPRPPCPASPLVRTRMLLPHEALLLAHAAEDPAA